jgi:hypothetical protein
MKTTRKVTCASDLEESDGANLDVGARTLGEGVVDEREEGVDGRAAEGGWVGAE